MASVDGHLLTADSGLTDHPTLEAITAAAREQRVLWLDLASSGEDTIAVLRDVFGFHPLAIEGVARFGQRPKIEVHCFYSEHYLVTVHQGELPAISVGCDAIRRHHPIGPPHPITALYHVLDALADSMFPLPGGVR